MIRNKYFLLAFRLIVGGAFFAAGFLGALLITGILRRPSALLASGLLIGFIILVGITMARGIDTDCGCFGSLSHRADWWLLLQDGVLLLMSLCVLFAKPGPRV
jgi:hypothetical protein